MKKFIAPALLFCLLSCGVQCLSAGTIDTVAGLDPSAFERWLAAHAAHVPLGARMMT